MTIRRHLYGPGKDGKPPEELIGLADYEQLFLGDCMGVALVRRGKDDPHIKFIPLVEKDRNWFPLSGGGSSSYWLTQAIQVLQAAWEWCHQNADPDISPNAAGFPPNTQFGWKFKEKK